jgi:phosphatidylglycerophosphatase C
LNLVFFDFDGTLTTRDTVLPFGMYLIRKCHARSVRKTACLFILLAGLKVRMLSNHGFKQRFCALLLRGASEQEVNLLSSGFANDFVTRVLNPPVVEAMRRHQRSGDEVYLLSSNFSFVLRPLHESWRSRGIIATEVESHNGRFTGKIVGRACDGREKLFRALALFGSDNLRAATAYGDSRSDRYIMEFVRKAFWV